MILSHRDIRHYAGGGAPLYVHEIFRRLTSKYDVTIVSTADSRLPQREVIDGLKIIRLRHPRLARITVPLSTLTQLVRGADLIVDNGDVAVPWLTPFYVRAPKLCIVYQVAREIFRHELRRPLSDMAMRLEPLVYRAYGRTKIVTCSESTKTDLVRVGLPERNITVVRPGIDESFLDVGSNAQKFDIPTIVCISRFMRYKGLHYAIRAMKYITENVPNAQLIIVGNGDDSLVRKELSEFQHAHAVKIVNRAPHNWDYEKKSLLSGAHLILIPSVREGYGIVAIEANACGTPAVGWNVAGLRDSIQDGETGILVPFGDTEQLAKQIVALLKDDDARERMGSSGIKWARDHSWDRAANDVGNLLESILTGVAK